MALFVEPAFCLSWESSYKALGVNPSATRFLVLSFVNKLQPLKNIRNIKDIVKVFFMQRLLQN
jgi:hypothetical protein